MFRNQSPGSRLQPVPAITPPPFGSFVHADSWGGSLLVAIFGVVLLLLAPWLTRGVVTADRWLIRSLLGPGTLEAAGPRSGAGPGPRWWTTRWPCCARWNATCTTGRRSGWPRWR